MTLFQLLPDGLEHDFGRNFDSMELTMGKLLVIAGLVLVGAGLLVIALGRLGLPLGRLPGDMVFRGKHVTVFAPLGTCILLSVLLTLILLFLARFRR